MEIHFLGTGTSHGVPMLACDCGVCTSSDPRDQRTRASVHVVMNGLRIQVDATPEFRIQALRARLRQIDLFILTHGHADHILGMDDLRRFCDGRPDGSLPVYCSIEGAERVRAIFPYAFAPRGEKPDGYARFDLRNMPGRLDLPEGTIESTSLPHGKVETLGLVFTERGSGARFAYYTDCKYLPLEARELARGADLLVLDGLRPTPHPTHMSISEAVEEAAKVGARRVLLTHVAHAVPHVYGESLGSHVQGFAYDGARVDL